MGTVTVIRSGSTWERLNKWEEEEVHPSPWALVCPQLGENSGWDYATQTDERPGGAWGVAAGRDMGTGLAARGRGGGCVIAFQRGSQAVLFIVFL